MTVLGAGANNLKVLIVEDQAEAREIIREMLLEFNIDQTFETENGQDALEFMKTSRDFIDLVICDWNMPNMSGLELLREIREVDSGIPFLMITGRLDLDSVNEAKEAGVTAYLGKPFSPEQLEAKIRILYQRILQTKAAMHIG